MPIHIKTLSHPLLDKLINRDSIDEISDESEADNLPPNERKPIIKLDNNEFLKLYQMKNAMHDSDREKAASIVSNLVLPERETLKKNPFLYKKLSKEPNLNLHAADLFKM